MKILYSCLSQSWGGMEMFTITSVEQLLKRNIQTELLCYPGSSIYTHAKKKGITLHTIKVRGYFHPLMIKKVVSIIKKNNFDLVHTQASKDLWVLSPALRFVSKHIPLLMTKQVGSFIVKKDFLHKYIYNRVTYALAISEVIKTNLLDTCPIGQDKVLLLHNSVDTKKFDPAFAQREKIRNEFKIEENEIVTGMLARFSPGKGHEEFIEAAKVLVKLYDNLKFLIVGEPSRGENNYGEKIVNLVKNYGLEEKIIFTGFRSDTSDVISAMDIFAFPSHSEAFGIALVEAMSMGKPTVCSSSDGVLDIAVEGETSYLFEKQNAEDLTNKLKLLIESKDLREQFGAAGRKRAIENFDLDLLTERVIYIYKRALNKSNK